eukprot:COSAG05_NODE_2557_length_2908_cov_14.229975_3_plen_165_part_00
MPEVVLPKSDLTRVRHIQNSTRVQLNACRNPEDMIVRFAIQQLSTPATCIARNACTGVLYCAHGKSDDHVFRISAECLTLVRSLLSYQKGAPRGAQVRRERNESRAANVMYVVNYDTGCAKRRAGLCQIQGTTSSSSSCESICASAPSPPLAWLAHPPLSWAMG